MENNSMPLWLAMMFAATFYEGCSRHANDKKKKELNFYCIDCLRSLCGNCLQPHLKHRFIQIRKYVYRNVVKVQDMKKFFNCSGVQTYSTNNNKVVHLTQKQSPSKNQPNISKNACLHCERSLLEPFHYCCLECKAFIIHSNGGQTEEIGEPSSMPSSSTLNADDHRNANTNNDGDDNGDPSANNNVDLSADNNGDLSADNNGDPSANNNVDLSADNNGDPSANNNVDLSADNNGDLSADNNGDLNANKNNDLDAGNNGDHVELPILVLSRNHARKQKKPSRSPFY